ncbi:hypothetical protein EON63_10160 [archaeon]|nr:MAG: hypothetical protein EON63_10160 [archaeon]
MVYGVCYMMYGIWCTVNGILKFLLCCFVYSPMLSNLFQVSSTTNSLSSSGTSWSARLGRKTEWIEARWSCILSGDILLRYVGLYGLDRYHVHTHPTHYFATNHTK